MTYRNEPVKRRFAHPLWTHLPAVAALVIMIVYLVYSSPLPGEAPVHFGPDGLPNRYGSPWEFIGLFLGLSVFFIILSSFIDERWARQENKKSFNWLCWLDDITVGWMAGVAIDYLLFLKNGGDTYSTNWALFAITAGGATLLALLIEALRPYRPYAGKPAARDAQYTEKELARQLKDNASFVYWESQNPAWVTLVSVFVPLIFIGSAIVVRLAEGWGLFTLIYVVFGVLIAAALFLFAFGGQRTVITRQELAVRWGLAGLRVLRLKTPEMTSVELLEFAPLKDFGGYGIRYGRGMAAYYLRGTRGVKITIVNGKKYLVGSDHPERLLAVLRLVSAKNG